MPLQCKLPAPVTVAHSMHRVLTRASSVAAARGLCVTPAKASRLKAAPSDICAQPLAPMQHPIVVQFWIRGKPGRINRSCGGRDDNKLESCQSRLGLTARSSSYSLRAWYGAVGHVPAWTAVFKLSLVSRTRPQSRNPLARKSSHLPCLVLWSASTWHCKLQAAPAGSVHFGQQSS